MVRDGVDFLARGPAVHVRGRGGDGSGEEGNESRLGEAEHGPEDWHGSGESGQVNAYCFFGIGGSIGGGGTGGVGVEVGVRGYLGENHGGRRECDVWSRLIAQEEEGSAWVVVVQDVNELLSITLDR